MIHFIGDVHGEFNRFRDICKQIPQEDTIIQVGDFGFWNHMSDRWNRQAGPHLERPIFFIEGNHDFLPALQSLKEETEVWPNAVYIPRGTIKVIGGYRMLFVGGASSVDGHWRARGIDYFPDLETIRHEDLVHITKDDEIDLMVTHTPPVSCVKDVFDPNDLVNFFGLSKEWTDYGTVILEAKWNELGNPPIICGHMHKAVQWNNVRILDILEHITMKDLGI